MRKAHVKFFVRQRAPVVDVQLLEDMQRHIPDSDLWEAESGYRQRYHHAGTAVAIAGMDDARALRVARRGDNGLQLHCTCKMTARWLCRAKRRTSSSTLSPLCFFSRVQCISVARMLFRIEITFCCFPAISAMSSANMKTERAV